MPRPLPPANNSAADFAFPPIEGDGASRIIAKLGSILQRTSRTNPARSKGQVMFVSRQRIVGRTNGSSAYVLDLAEAARDSGFEPHLLQPSPDIMGRWPIMRLRPEMGVFKTHKIRGVFKFGPVIISLDPSVFRDAMLAGLIRLALRAGMKASWLIDRPRPYSIAAPWTHADRSFVSRHAGRQAEIVIADYAFQSEAIKLLPGHPSAIIMHDLFHTRAAKAHGRDSVNGLEREQEIALLSRADAVISIQSDEARFVAENVPATRSILAPIAIDPIDAAQPGKTGRLLFVGSNTAPNVVCLEWFFDNAWPAIKTRSPTITLDIVGSVAAAFPAGGPRGIRFHGVVDDLTALYAEAAIVISPLTFGSGLKVKLVEAMAYGKAIVATATTLQGVESICTGAVIRADTAEAFIEAVLSLENVQLRRTLGQAALSVARTHFSRRACHAAFASWLEENRPAANVKGREGALI